MRFSPFLNLKRGMHESPHRGIRTMKSRDISIAYKIICVFRGIYARSKYIKFQLAVKSATRGLSRNIGVTKWDLSIISEATRAESGSLPRIERHRDAAFLIQSVLISEYNRD